MKRNGPARAALPGGGRRRAAGCSRCPPCSRLFAPSFRHPTLTPPDPSPPPTARQVLSLPDGVISGRRSDLASVAAAADAAAAAAAAASAARWLERLRGGGDAGSSGGGGGINSGGGPGGGRSLNTVAERGVVPEGPQSLPEDEELEALVAAQLEAVGAGSSGSGFSGAQGASGGGGGGGGGAPAELLALEAVVWGELDAIAALQLRVAGRRSSLPYGLLQLRPPPACGRGGGGGGGGGSGGGSGSVSANSSGSSSGGESSGGGSGGGYAHAASDGLEVFADPLLPPLRRCARLSWAVAGVLDLHQGEGRQALLEAGSAAGRLRAAAAQLIRRRRRLVAISSVSEIF
jgi:hypothetical protein